VAVELVAVVVTGELLAVVVAVVLVVVVRWES
jgi:hypothetical protein